MTPKMTPNAVYTYATTKLRQYNIDPRIVASILPSDKTGIVDVVTYSGKRFKIKSSILYENAGPKIGQFLMRERLMRTAIVLTRLTLNEYVPIEKIREEVSKRSIHQLNYWVKTIIEDHYSGDRGRLKANLEDLILLETPRQIHSDVTLKRLEKADEGLLFDEASRLMIEKSTLVDGIKKQQWRNLIDRLEEKIQ